MMMTSFERDITRRSSDPTKPLDTVIYELKNGDVEKIFDGGVLDAFSESNQNRLHEDR